MNFLIQFIQSPLFSSFSYIFTILLNRFAETSHLFYYQSSEFIRNALSNTTNSNISNTNIVNSSPSRPSHTDLINFSQKIRTFDHIICSFLSIFLTFSQSSHLFPLFISHNFLNVFLTNFLKKKSFFESQKLQFCHHFSIYPNWSSNVNMSSQSPNDSLMMSNINSHTHSHSHFEPLFNRQSNILIVKLLTSLTLTASTIPDVNNNMNNNDKVNIKNLNINNIKNNIDILMAIYPQMNETKSNFYKELSLFLPAFFNSQLSFISSFHNFLTPDSSSLSSKVHSPHLILLLISNKSTHLSFCLN
jgi:hypothetical protein